MTIQSGVIIIFKSHLTSVIDSSSDMSVTQSDMPVSWSANIAIYLNKLLVYCGPTWLVI